MSFVGSGARVAMSSIPRLVVLGALLVGCASSSNDEWTHTLPSPVAAPRNECEATYLEWVSATYVFEGVSPLFDADAIDPLYRACNAAELVDAGNLYPVWGCVDPPDSCRFEPVFGPHFLDDDTSARTIVRRELGHLCDKHVGSRLCRDLAASDE